MSKFVLQMTSTISPLQTLYLMFYRMGHLSSLGGGINLRSRQMLWSLEQWSTHVIYCRLTDNTFYCMSALSIFPHLKPSFRSDVVRFNEQRDILGKILIFFILIIHQVSNGKCAEFMNLQHNTGHCP